MASDRRMFSNDIVKTDAFLGMSVEARALYFHLVMHADNRGYISNAKSIMSIFDDVNIGHLEELIFNKFVLDRGKNLYLIKHWYIHNDIPTRRIEESRYIDDLKSVYFDENFSYTTRVTDKPVVETLKIFLREKGKHRNRKKKESEKEIEIESEK